MMMRRSVRVAAGACSALSLMAMLSMSCSKTPEPSASSPPLAAPEKAAASPSASPVAAAPKGPNEVGWTAPASWQKTENPNPMRKATYRIPRASGDPEDAELSVSQAGGSVEMNIQRWAGQFEKQPADAVKRSERTVSGLKVTVVEIQGTFMGSAMPGTPPTAPKPSYALLAAIVETAGTSTFFKLTGPNKTVTAAKADFDKLIESITPK